MKQATLLSRSIDQDCEPHQISHERVRIQGTGSGYINIVKDVFGALVAYFEDGEARDDSRTKIDKFKFFLYELYEVNNEADIVPRPNEEFATLQL
mmetsp:Transcript_1998/g.4802  ORF Transcript_1998/g.4802 Transcript_1998/m.4802 type:complete len:95 (+) Transcript_1998:99-383(+)